MTSPVHTSSSLPNDAPADMAWGAFHETAPWTLDLETITWRTAAGELRASAQREIPVLTTPTKVPPFARLITVVWVLGSALLPWWWKKKRNRFASPEDSRALLSLRMRNTLAITLRRARLAEQDALTGLSNRQRFNTILDWALTYARRMRVVGAVLQIGVDRFAQVNEALGTSVGDRVLQEVARRLMECVRDMDLVSTPDGQAQENYSVELSRIGSDEFSILLPVVQRGEQAATVAQRIHNALAVPFRVLGNELVLTCCIGIAVFPDDGMNRDTLLANAGAAMAHAKAQGRDRLVRCPCVK